MPGLSLFAPRMIASAELVVSTANILRQVRDSSGDMPWSWLMQIQDLLERVETAAASALAEGEKSPIAATSFMNDMGGPVTLVAFADGLTEAKAAGVAWGDMLAAWLDAKPASLVRKVERLQRGGGGDVARITTPSMIPRQAANEIRTAPELAALIAAFEAVGG